ncbi:MAG TPA: EAL domain-containing protein [Geothermobacteraceae bacterium]|nr:EAL domain-containing protein [Geothermobacteraceae bacterium]
MSPQTATATTCLPEGLFATTGQAFLSALLPCFHSLCGSRQLLVVRSSDDPSSAPEIAFSAGFSAEVDPDGCLGSGLPSLGQILEPSWVWPDSANHRCPDDPLLRATGAGAFLGSALQDDAGKPFGWLLIYGPSCDESPELVQLLKCAGKRTAAELNRLDNMHALIKQARLHQTVLNANPMPIFFKDAEGKYLGCNDAFVKFLNKPREEILGQEVFGVAPSTLAEVYRQADLELIKQGGTQVYESAVVTGSGDRRDVIFHKAVFYDEVGNKAGISGTVVDVTQLRAAENEARYLAHFDSVTGLPNQTLLRDRLEQELLHAEHGRRELAVLCLDLDRFKKINNAYGHEFGDQVLANVAQRLRKVLEAEDTVARLGGDSFVVLAQLRPGNRSAREVAKSLLETVRQPMLLEERRLFLSASIGIAVYPHDGRDARALLSHSDAAQAQAKQKQQGDLRFFTPAMNTVVTEQLLLEEHLRRAIEEEQFFLLYQPQVDAATGQVIGAEALLRWRHPLWGLVEPDRFIPLAEQTQLIRPLGEMVLLQACQQARRWQDDDLGRLRVAVNLSPMQFQDQDLVTKVRRILDQTGLEPWRLGLEITETEVMRDFDHAIHCLTRFREVGLHLAVDDFGTGYSSLSYLKHFPIDLLKIDRSFISGLPECRDDAAIVTAIIAMGFGLGLKVMAEGVETADQERFLTELGCVAFQGYYFGRPLTADAFTKLLRTPRVAHG